MLIALKWLKIEVRDLDGRKQIILVTASLKKRIVLVCFSVLGPVVRKPIDLIQD